MEESGGKLMNSLGKVVNARLTAGISLPFSPRPERKHLL